MILHAGYARTDAEKEAFYTEAESLAQLIWREPGTEPEGFNNFDAFARQWSHHAYAKEDWVASRAALQARLHHHAVAHAGSQARARHPALWQLGTCR